MEGDYFELSQFPYNSYMFPLGTTGFLTDSWGRRGGVAVRLWEYSKRKTSVRDASRICIKKLDYRYIYTCSGWSRVGKIRPIPSPYKGQENPCRPGQVHCASLDCTNNAYMTSRWVYFLQSREPYVTSGKLNQALRIKLSEDWRNLFQMKYLSAEIGLLRSNLLTPFH